MITTIYINHRCRKQIQIVFLSVIIPTYNRSLHLRYTLLSVAAQKKISFSDFEVIVVDDGSSDDSKDVIWAFSGIINISYLYQDDLGYRVSSARNLGIEASRGDVLLFIDCGILLDEECLKEHIEHHQSTVKKCVVVGSILGIALTSEANEKFKELINPLDIKASFLSLHAANCDEDIRKAVFAMCNKEFDCLPAPWSLSWTGNLSVVKSEIVSVGCFDKCYDGRWGMEDIDLAFRLYLKGIAFKYLGAAASIHYPHISNFAEKLEDERLNKIYFNNKFHTKESKLLLSSSTMELNLLLSDNSAL